MRVGLLRKLSVNDLMFLNCGVGEDSWESLGLKAVPASPFWGRLAMWFPWKEYAKDEAPILWPPSAKSWLIGKDCDAGRDWGQEAKGTTEDERWLDGITNFWSSLRLTSIESVMSSSHLILGRTLLLLHSVPPSIRVFSNESTLHEVAKVLEFQLQHQSFQWNITQP